MNDKQSFNPLFILIPILVFYMMLNHENVSYIPMISIFLLLFLFIRLAETCFYLYLFSRVMKCGFYFGLAILLLTGYDLNIHALKIPAFDNAVAYYLFLVAVLECLDLFFEFIEKPIVAIAPNLPSIFICLYWQLIVVFGISLFIWTFLSPHSPLVMIINWAR
jgi:hypothetical protein